MKAVELMPAVGYVRMSDDECKLSPEQQCREIEEYASRASYQIIGWYSDEGISASKGDELRVAYQQMLIDSNARDFRAVLCWSTSRFTRNHPHEAAQGKRILKTNGIWLDTVREGKIDWNSFEGVIKDSIYNIIDHTFSVGLGKDSLRGRRNTFLAGGYPYGNIPFGYNHLYISGNERREVRRGTKTKNLRGWIQSLVIVPDEAVIVRRIFNLYVYQDYSLCAIARQLNLKGIAGPGKGVNAVWTVQNVRTRLRCAASAGISRIGGKPEGYRKAHNRIALEERQGAWEAIIDRETWDLACEKLEGNKGHAQEGRSGALQGILRCGVCGHVLHKENARKADDPRGDMYRCNSSAKGLLTNCRRWTCYEADILPRLIPELVSAVDEEMMLLLQAAPEKPGQITNREVFQAHLESLEQRMAEAAEAFTDPGVSSAMKKALEKKVEEWDAEATDTRRRLEAIAATSREGGMQATLAWWKKIRPSLLILSGHDASKVVEEVPIEAQDENGNWRPVGHFVSDNDGGEGAVLTEERFSAVRQDGSPAPVIADPGKLRALLHRLKVQVRVFWRLVTDEERAARRKGRGHGCPGRLPDWVVDTARLSVEINCGSSDSRNVSGGRHALGRRGNSRHRASREP